jgi:hypothetical protein
MRERWLLRWAELIMHRVRTRARRCEFGECIQLQKKPPRTREALHCTRALPDFFISGT